MVASHLIGRDDELATLRAALDLATTAGPVGLLIEGAAGIGKSVLLEAAVASASERDFRVLTSRAAEAESSWSLLAVGDLLEGVPPEVVEPLPAPQRRALDVVMRRAEPDGRPVENATIGAGLRAIITALATEEPLLLLLDDLHWLDDASAAVIGYVLRRLTTERVAVVATRRLPEPPRLDLDAVLPATRSTRLKLEPFSLGALRTLLAERISTPVTRATLVRIHDASQGNPLFALEIARTLEEVGTPAIGQPLPVPGDVRELIRRRVADLPRPTAQVLLRAALDGRVRTGLPPAALGLDDLSSLADAERAGMVRLEGGVVRFAHPFYAGAILENASAQETRTMRLRLAADSASVEERAGHLARATDEADAAVAEAIEVGAEAAFGRGAVLDAAVLFERAWLLTPPEKSDDAVRRALTTAKYYAHLGEHATAEQVLDRVEEDLLGEEEQAEALRLRAGIKYAQDDWTAAESALTEALDHDADAHRCAISLIHLASMSREHDKAQQVGRALLQRVDPVRDGPLYAEALVNTAVADFRAGHGLDWERVERALELEDRDAVPIDTDPPSAIAAYLAVYAHRFDEARSLLQEVRDDLIVRGLEDGFVHEWLGRVEFLTGDFRTAAAVYDEGIAIAELTGHTSLVELFSSSRELVDVVQDAEAAVRRQVAAPPPMGAHGSNRTMRVALLSSLSGVEPELAWEVCRERIAGVQRYGLLEPAIDDWVPDAVEVLAARGDHTDATTLVEMWDERGRASGQPWVLALGARCRAVLLAASGDHAAAVEAAEEALEHHGRAADLPFERARALLVLGASLRRVRRRADARRTLEEASAAFERMECRIWAERARTELDRIGGRAASKGDLTPSERRVVDLAAAGATNKEIAATLTVSVHTVEAHLSHAFVKLGITRRAQLTSRLAAEEGPGEQQVKD